MKDNFSDQADVYARYRPVYPANLFEHIFSFIPHRKLAWDCGTGNGQSAAVLAGYFDKVVATDISQQQLNNVVIKKNIMYIHEPAEHTSLKEKSVDLITISQALHWFDFKSFYAEVKRVGSSDAIIAAWAYSLLQIDPIIDAIIYTYHFETLKKYWDAERRYVDENYATIPFPFRLIESPSFQLLNNWTLQDLEGYLNTWSALQKFIRVNKYNPVPELITQISKYWPEGEEKQIKFPIHLKMGQVH
jgi:ubiquinone/menaquinone biosynthesis C-methylase UbiE